LKSSINLANSFLPVKVFRNRFWVDLPLFYEPGVELLAFGVYTGRCIELKRIRMTSERGYSLAFGDYTIFPPLGMRSGCTVFILPLLLINAKSIYIIHLGIR
jgi:hypothetical protein